MSNPNRRGALALVSASMCWCWRPCSPSGSRPPPPSPPPGRPRCPPPPTGGLSFPTEGESPVGNATAEDLARYGAYYLGDTSKKVLYLTFDCGYENGHTEAILDALKKHDAPAPSLWWATWWNPPRISSAAWLRRATSWATTPSTTRTCPPYRT